ncbi:hypothetical protein A2671_01520 [Candidatus Kaiserbacteria bacterium RIFCSPHIGHO2_01_FULL_49_13]|uniref:Uncharacterized protein n=1 Tax=Candidatus Kaiserbacteria bacterium RIFCSPHIGHO2_01_FULL_49_13 TaxID=1798477 RepID=A0A1F6CEL1_9BACT|nr:MAG: hypothetical protein A2671_01520 [Candidatus Kaiserbacteria bacterium RIFCSPHIGHO2_01_FULL_49_13]
MTNQELKIRIMRRVYVIYYVRKALSPRALKMYALIAACLGTASVVSVSNVLQNMPSDVAGISSFFIAAFANTKLIVQLLTAGAIVTLLALLADLVRSFSGAPRLTRVA